MRTLDRYVVRTLLVTALVFFVVMMALRVCADLFLNMDEFTESGTGRQAKGIVDTIAQIVTYYRYQSLVYFRDLGWLIIVAAAAFTLAWMNHTNELTAMLASGVSLHRVLLPIIVCAIGLTFGWALFRRFGVNFSLFADVRDFLTSTFREPTTFLLAGSAVAVGWLVRRPNRIEDRRLGSPEDRGRPARGDAWVRSRLAPRYWPLAFAVGYCLLFSHEDANREAELIRAGETGGVRVLTSAGARLEPVQTGATSRHLMFNDAEPGRVGIFPQEAVSRMMAEGAQPGSGGQ